MGLGELPEKYDGDRGMNPDGAACSAIDAFGAKPLRIRNDGPDSQSVLSADMPEEPFPQSQDTEGLKMKRMVCLVALGILLLCGAVRAERKIYTEQNGVRVFSEDGLAGLMDADGNVLLDAQFRMIYPFAGDYAVAETAYHDSKGVISKDGRIVIPCEYTDIEMWPERDRATAYTPEYEYGRFVDLKTGETVLEGHCVIWMEGGDTVRMSFSDYGGWDYDGREFVNGPFFAEVFDGRMNLRFGVDRKIITRMGDGYYLTESDEEDAEWIRSDYWDAYRIIDSSGHPVLDDLCSFPWEDGDGAVHYTRAVRSPLWGLYRIAKRFAPGIVLSARESLKRHETAFNNMKTAVKTFEVSGILRPDGSRMEVPGSVLSERDEEGLYRAKALNLWGYVTGDGEWAIPPVYRQARAFVNGSAIVSLKENEWFLIDRNGRQVGNLVWDVNLLDYGISGGGEYVENCSDVSRIIPVPSGSGICLYDHGGRRICADSFPRTEGFYPGLEGSVRFLDRRRIAINDAEGNTCVVDDRGNVTARVPAKSFHLADWRIPYSFVYCDEGNSWLETDILKDLGWPNEAEYARVLWSRGYGNVLWAQRTDGSCLYMNTRGEALCPAGSY